MYAKTGFEFYGDFPSREIINKNFIKYDKFASQGKLDKDIEGYNDFKFIFYYKNYEEYKTYLSKYKNMSLKEFTKKFTKDE